MTRATPAITTRVGATATIDPLWALLFPVYHFFTLGYGAFASVYYVPQLRGPEAAGDPVGAQLFGICVLTASLLALAGALHTLFARRDGLELFGSAAFTIMMLIYFLSLTYLVGMHSPGTRPGSAFVPICMGVPPAFRWAVIYRDRKRRRRAGGNS